MENENTPFWFNKKLLYGSFVILNFIIGLLLILEYDSCFPFFIVFLFLLCSVLLHIRWFMRISSYEMDIRQKTQGEVLKNAMAANATMFFR